MMMMMLIKIMVCRDWQYTVADSVIPENVFCLLKCRNGR